MLHKHKCENPYCALIFEHEVPDTTGMTKAEGNKFYDAGHMCPRCHTGPYKLRYFENSAEREKFEKQALGELLLKLLNLFEDEEKDSEPEDIHVFHV